MNTSKPGALAAAIRNPSPRPHTPAPAPLTAQDCDPKAVLDAIQEAWAPMPPMPTEPTSGHCCYAWWNTLPYSAGEGPGFLCTEPAGHPGKTHRVDSRDGELIAEHVEMGELA